VVIRPGLSNVISVLRNSDPALAVRLARTTVAKLQKDSLIATPDAAQLAMNLLRLAHSPAPRVPKPDGTVDMMEIPLLSGRGLSRTFRQGADRGAGHALNSTAPYTLESSSAQTILSSLKSMPAEMKMYAPASISTAEAKLTALTNAGNPDNQIRQTIQEPSIKNRSIVALESIRQAPPNMRDSLYQQLSR
jgi:hypothetical protein